MKPIKRLMTIATAACSILAATLLQGCTKEDLSDCGILVKFTYTRNVDGVDKFPTDIDKISLYVFDAEGCFVGEYHDQGAHLDASYQMKLKLPSGKYSFIAWGNCAECYDLPDFTPGFTMLDDVRLSFMCPSGVVDTYPEHLYHGARNNLEVTPSSSGRQRVEIDMMKNTNTIRVIKKGLPSGEPGAFSCHILSTNADYKFDNSITGTRRLKYIPQDSHVDGNPVSDFRVLRECNDNCTKSKLVIVHHAPNGDDEIYNVSLIPLLIRASQTGDLDIDDYFELVVELDYTYGNVTIRINDWVAVNGGGMVG